MRISVLELAKYFNGSIFSRLFSRGENFLLNIEPEVMYGAGSGSGWGKFVLFYFRIRILFKVKNFGIRSYQMNIYLL